MRYSQLGDRVADNVNAIGQIRDDDRRELDTAVEKTIWLRGLPIERFRYDSNYNIYWAHTTGTLRSWEVEEGVWLDFRNRLSAGLEHVEEYKVFEKDFRNRQTSLTLRYNTREYQSVTAGYERGRDSMLTTSSGGHPRSVS